MKSFIIISFSKLIQYNQNMPLSFDRAVKEINSILADLSYDYRHYRKYKNVYETVQDLPVVRELVSENRRLKRELRHATSSSAAATSHHSHHSRRKYGENSSDSETDCVDEPAVEIPAARRHHPHPMHESVVQSVEFVRNAVAEDAIVITNVHTVAESVVCDDNVCVVQHTTGEPVVMAQQQQQQQQQQPVNEETEETVEEDEAVEYEEVEETVEEVEYEEVEETVEEEEETVVYEEVEETVEEPVEEEVEYEEVEEPVEEEEEVEEEELVEITVKGKSYYASDMVNSEIYAIDAEGDVGDAVGRFHDGKASFY